MMYGKSDEKFSMKESWKNKVRNHLGHELATSPRRLAKEVSLRPRSRAHDDAMGIADRRFSIELNGTYHSKPLIPSNKKGDKNCIIRIHLHPPLALYLPRYE